MSNPPGWWSSIPPEQIARGVLEVRDHITKEQFEHLRTEWVKRMGNDDLLMLPRGYVRHRISQEFSSPPGRDLKAEAMAELDEIDRAWGVL